VATEFIAGAEYFFIEFQKSQVVPRSTDGFVLGSPNTVTGVTLFATGAYQLINKPLSVQLESSLWIPDYNQNPFKEFTFKYSTDFYDALVSNPPTYLDYLRQTRNTAKAPNMFPPYVFNSDGYYSLPQNCQPKVFPSIKPGLPGFSAEGKRMEKSQKPELVTYGIMSIHETHFEDEEEFYFSDPLIGIGLISIGFIGYYSCLEMVGASCFVSVLSKPFILRTNDHNSASDYITSVAETYGSKVRGWIEKAKIEKKNNNYTPGTSNIFWKKLNKNNLVSHRGVTWTRDPVDGYFYKFIHLHHFWTVTVDCASLAPSAGSSAFEIEAALGKSYSLDVEENEGLEWSLACSYSYHIYRVYSIYSRLTNRHKALVSARLLHGSCIALVESQFVGDRDVVEADLNKDNMDVLAEAMIWLAERQLLYIDFRLPNIRIDSKTNSVYLIDYDDMVILKEKLCCGRTVCRRLFANRFGRIRLKENPLLKKVLEERVCQSCIDIEAEIEVPIYENRKTEK
jgi:hypothetical protein